jgi:hypothetical protein
LPFGSEVIPMKKIQKTLTRTAVTMAVETILNMCPLDPA